MRRLLGIAALLHALAHSGVGMWAQGPVWLVTTLWFVAMCGWLATALALLGQMPVRFEARVSAVAATVASVVLARLVGTMPFTLAGLAINAILVALTWRVLTQQHRQATARLFDDSGSLSDASGAVPNAAAGGRRRFGRATGRALLLYTAMLILARPLTIRWGTTAEERATALPGDEVQAPGGRYRIEHAVTINAPAGDVFAWLAQIGQDRGGFYSYEWLERAFGVDVHNADSLVPAWQQRKVGDLVRAVQPRYLGGRFGDSLGWRITRFDPGRVMILKNWGSFVVVPLDSAQVRLIARTLGDGTPSFLALPFTPLGMMGFEPAHFIMQRGMLLGIKERAERQRTMPLNR